LQSGHPVPGGRKNPRTNRFPPRRQFLNVARYGAGLVSKRGIDGSYAPHDLSMRLVSLSVISGLSSRFPVLFPACSLSFYTPPKNKPPVPKIPIPIITPAPIPNPPSWQFFLPRPFPKNHFFTISCLFCALIARGRPSSISSNIFCKLKNHTWKPPPPQLDLFAALPSQSPTTRHNFFADVSRPAPPANAFVSVLINGGSLVLEAAACCRFFPFFFFFFFFSFFFFFFSFFFFYFFFLFFLFFSVFSAHCQPQQSRKQSLSPLRSWSHSV